MRRCCDPKASDRYAPSEKPISPIWLGSACGCFSAKSSKSEITRIQLGNSRQMVVTSAHCGIRGCEVVWNKDADSPARQQFSHGQRPGVVQPSGAMKGADDGETALGARGENIDREFASR